MPFVFPATFLLLFLFVLANSLRVLREYERGVVFRLGRVQGTRAPGIHIIIPFVDVLHRVSLRIVTMPIQSQGIITRDNVSVDVSAVAYYRVVDAVKSVVYIKMSAPLSTKSRRSRYGRWSGSTPSIRPATCIAWSRLAWTRTPQWTSGTR